MKLRSNPYLVAALIFASAASLQAATLYWDGTDTTANADGGVGTWDTIATNWDDAATAGNPVAWPSSGSDNDAVFGTPAGLVTIDPAGVSANDVSFGLTGYTVTGGTLTLNGTTNILTSTAAVSGTTVTNLTISAPLAGTTGFTKAGVGNVVLSGNNSGLSGIVTINNATGTNNSGLTLSGAGAPGGITQVDVGGTAVADGSFLGLANTTLGAGVTLNLSGQGGNSAPIGTLRGTGGAVTVNGPVNLLTGNVRISNFGGTSLTLNGAVTTTPSTNGFSIRFADNQGVIFTNPANNWTGTTTLSQGSAYFYPNTLPANSPLLIGASLAGDFGTNGIFNRALGNLAGQVAFGRANDGQRANGVTARGGSLVVNFGGAGGDLLFFDTFAKTGATSTSATVTLTDATNIVAGMSVTGSGVPIDTLVNTVVGTTVTLNKATTTTVASNALTFYAAQNNARINSSVFVLNGANADSPISLANPLDLNGFARTIQVSANTATLAGYLKNSSTAAASVRKTGAGALIQDPGAAYALTLAGLNTSAGTLELKSGTYTITGSAGTSAPASTTGFVVATGGTFRLSGATVNATGGSFVFPAGNTGGGSSNFILDSGTFDGGTKEALNAYGAAGTTTINGGLFICGTFRVSQNTGFLNLNGGTLRTTNLSTGGGTATVNLNGGTLQAKAANATFIATGITVAQVQAGGAVIDSNGFAITIPKSLTEDPGSIGGGLIKKGAGTLTLTAANSYTGPTSVTVGTLALVGGSQTSPITVDSGAALGFTLGSPTTSTSTVTFSGATAKVTVTGTPVAATLMTASNIIGTPVLDPAIPGYVLAIEGGGTLLNLKSTSPSANYDTWATTNGVTGQAANLDHDNDGVSNGVEYFIGGPTGNTTGFTPVPGVTTTAGVSSITWIKASTYTGVYNTDYFVETSATLAAGSWVTEASPGTVAISGNNVTYTFPAGPVKNFARLKVTGP